MGYQLQNRLSISIFIDGTEYPLGAVNLLNNLHMATTVRGRLPVLSMTINDVSHVFDTLNLQDGIPIQVIISNGQSSKTYNFRKFNHKRIQTSGSYTYMIYGYWDSPLYWSATACAGIQGTSNTVLQTIASKCGLKYDGMATSDSQLWMPKNKAYSIFAKDVADNGYITANSCTSIGVDLDGTLRYKDVNNLPAPVKKIVGYQYVQGSYTALEITVSANSGLNNAISGYQNMRYIQSSVGKTLQQQLQNISFTPDSKSPLYNTALKTKISRGPVSFGPIDVGNVHTNYELANYQNIRYRNLFSMGLELMIPQMSDFQLLEQVSLSVLREDLQSDLGNSGIYTVSGHAIYIQGATYMEKLEVVRHGSNEANLSG